MQFHEAITDDSTGKEPMQSSAYSCYQEGIVGRAALELYKTYKYRLAKAKEFEDAWVLQKLP